MLPKNGIAQSICLICCSLLLASCGVSSNSNTSVSSQVDGATQETEIVTDETTISQTTTICTTTTEELTTESTTATTTPVNEYEEYGEAASYVRRIRENQIPIDGFDESNNSSYTFKNIKLSIPQYYNDPVVRSYLTGLSVDDKTTDQNAVILMYNSETDFMSSDEFIANKDEYLNTVIQEFSNSESVEYLYYSEPKEIEADKYKGIYYQYISKDKYELLGFNTVVVLYNEASHTLVRIGMYETETSQYNYLDDFWKIIDSIEIIGGDE